MTDEIEELSLPENTEVDESQVWREFGTQWDRLTLEADRLIEELGRDHPVIKYAKLLGDYGSLDELRKEFATALPKEAEFLLWNNWLAEKGLAMPFLINSSIIGEKDRASFEGLLKACLDIKKTLAKLPNITFNEGPPPPIGQMVEPDYENSQYELRQSGPINYALLTYKPSKDTVWDAFDSAYTSTEPDQRGRLIIGMRRYPITVNGLTIRGVLLPFIPAEWR